MRFVSVRSPPGTRPYQRPRPQPRKVRTALGVASTLRNTTGRHDRASRPLTGAMRRHLLRRRRRLLPNHVGRQRATGQRRNRYRSHALATRPLRRLRSRRRPGRARRSLPSASNHPPTPPLPTKGRGSPRSGRGWYAVRTSTEPRSSAGRLPPLWPDPPRGLRSVVRTRARPPATSAQPLRRTALVPCRRPTIRPRPLPARAPERPRPARGASSARRAARPTARARLRRRAALCSGHQHPRATGAVSPKADLLALRKGVPRASHRRRAVRRCCAGNRRRCSDPRLP